MNTKIQNYQPSKLRYIFILLCLLILNLAPTSRVGAYAESGENNLQVGSEFGSDTCYPGTGWVWTTGPKQPETALKVEAALAKDGIQATVIAVGFGEKDSCGNFELFATDFSLTLKGNLSFASSKEQELADRILPRLSQWAKPRLGNVRLTFGPGNIKFYSSNKATSSTGGVSPSHSSISATLNKKVYLLVYNPILSNGQDFNTYMGWTPYTTLVQDIIDSFKTTSHGQLQYTVTYKRVITSKSGWPVKIDGFRYTEAKYLAAYQNNTPHQPNDVDYDAIIGNLNFDICGRLNRGEIDELWIYGGPYDGFYESRLVGPGGYWYNSPPMDNSHGCNKLLPIMGLNFERGVAEALHSFGHRAESTMVEVYGDWQNNRTAHNWDRFALVKALSPNYSYSGCGNIHYPPNGVTDYDYGNTGTVKSNCEDFGNYPNLSDPLAVAQPITCTAWDCTFDPHLAYMEYWYSHLPANAGCGPDSVANNWWLYFSKPSAALYPPPPCPPRRPDLVPYPLPGRIDPVVASSTSGTMTNSPLYSGRLVYFDWGFQNIGNEDVNTNYYVDLYIDDQRFVHYPFSWLGTGYATGFEDWSETWHGPGWHTVKLIVDPENTVAERDETNNVWEKQFYWNSPKVFRSTVNDGWILESSENSNQGGATNDVNTTFFLGDDANNKQSRAILHFNTASLPDNAVITKVVLKIKKQGLVGTDPFTTHNKIAVDIRQGAFSNSIALQPADFQAGPSKLAVGLIANNPQAGDWYFTNLDAIAYPYINLTGVTQFRLRFQLDDNNDLGADFLKFYSGDAATSAYRPVLIITYHLP